LKRGFFWFNILDGTVYGGGDVRVGEKGKNTIEEVGEGHFKEEYLWEVYSEKENRGWGQVTKEKGKTKGRKYWG